MSLSTWGRVTCSRPRLTSARGDRQGNHRPSQNSHRHMGLERQLLEDFGKDVEEEQVGEKGEEEGEGGKSKPLTKFGGRMATSE